MASVKKFEDLEVWILSRELSKRIYDLIVSKHEERYNPLANQIDRSSGSVMDNIAEGFGRGGNKEFANFQSISKGSANEVKSQLYRALDRKYISELQHKELLPSVELIIKKLGAFIAYLKSVEFKGIKFVEEPPAEYNLS